jgi:hypothetical protein
MSSSLIKYVELVAYKSMVSLHARLSLLGLHLLMESVRLGALIGGHSINYGVDLFTVG